MSLALPAAPQQSSRRQLLVSTALVAAAAAMLIAGMLAMWMRFRAGAPTRESSDGLKIIKDWMPKSITIPEVAANTMFATYPFTALMAQWAVYSAKRKDRGHTSLALLITFVLGIAIINAQIAIYMKMELGLADGAFQTLFYAITGTVMFLVIAGMAFSAVALFRQIGGRDDDQQLISAHALYWYFLTAAFTAVWFFVYVQK